MRVLSLFDGISCGRVALERAGIPVKCYYASEIDKYAIKVALKNYPNTIELGDINAIDFKSLAGKIDLIIGGSPCQDLSVAKKNREGLSGKHSGLFWKFVEAVETIKPRFFLLENVASMSKENKDIITKALGVEPILINSALVSAQQRKRLYWCNWNVAQPEDKGILLKDILESGEVWEKKGYCLTANYNGAYFPHDYLRKQRQMVAEPIHFKMPNGKMAEVPPSSFKEAFMFKEVRTEEGKRVRIKIRQETGLDATKRDAVSKKYISQVSGKVNCLTTSIGCEQIVCEPVRLGEIGKDCQGNRVYSVRGKSVCLNAHGGGLGAKTGLYKIDLPDGDYYVRKLTPVECERLQTLPDGYTEGVSQTQRYKAIGNGWTVDVIAHILKEIKGAD